MTYMESRWKDWGIFGYTEKERVMLIKVHQGYGLHYLQFIKTSEADDDNKLFDSISNLYKAIKMEGLEESREVIAMGDYCVVSVSWKWRPLMEDGMLEMMYLKANNLNKKIILSYTL